MKKYNLKFIESLHKKYARNESDFELVWTHCKIVWEICKEIIANKHLSVDTNFVMVGALLHDIGSYREFNINHGITGEKILRAEGFPEKVCLVASHHTGVGISRKDIIAQKLNWPLGNFFPKISSKN